MPKFGNQRSSLEWLHSKPVLLLFFLLICFLALSVWERWQVERAVYAERQITEEELNRELGRKLQLENRVLYLEDERGIEEEIRKHFDVAKEGETVVVLMGESEQPRLVDSAEVARQKRWYEFWR